MLEEVLEQERRPVRRKPKPMYDVKTKNISFKQTAADLNRLGIKNNLFFLELYDKSLQGLDPYSPLLTQDMIVRIINECIINPWYFLREIARIPVAGANSVPFQLHRANLAVTFLFLNGIDNYVTISRQKGKTQSIVAILLWAFLFGTTNSEMLFVNIKEEGAINNLNRLKAQRDCLPPYLQFKITYSDDGKEIKGFNSNVKTLINFSNNNKIVVAPAATSVGKAESVGRGYTQSIQYFDEFEFINHIATIMEAAGPAFKKASQNAKDNHAIYGRLFSSTPGDLDSGPGKEAYDILENTCRWTEKMYDIFKDEGEVGLREYVRCNSTNAIVYIEYDYKQLGEDDEWFYGMCEVLNNKPSKIARELLLKRISGSSLSPFSPEDLMALEDSMGEVIEERFIMPMYKLDVYSDLDPNKCYFVGVDVSNGYGQDNSAVIILDPYELKVVAEFSSPYIGTTELYKFLRILVKRHIPRSILCIERNANGESVIGMLRETDVRHSLYMGQDKELLGSQIDDKLDKNGWLKKQAATRKLYGVWTGTNSRKVMFTLLDKYMNEDRKLFKSRTVIRDIKALIMKNGKIQAGPGAHDDSIMALLMALYVYHYGTNLKRYGFYKGEFIEKKPQDQVEDLNKMLAEIPELRHIYGNTNTTKTSDDYELDMMKEINRLRNEDKDYSYTDINSNLTVKVEDYGNTFEDDSNEKSGYSSIGGGFFDFLNS